MLSNYKLIVVFGLSSLLVSAAQLEVAQNVEEVALPEVQTTEIKTPVSLKEPVTKEDPAYTNFVRLLCAVWVVGIVASTCLLASSEKVEDEST